MPKNLTKNMLLIQKQWHTEKYILNTCKEGSVSRLNIHVFLDLKKKPIP